VTVEMGGASGKGVCLKGVGIIGGRKGGDEKE